MNSKMEDEQYDENFKKYLTNIVSNSLNKKIHILNNKLDSIAVLLESNLNLNNCIFDFLKKNQDISLKQKMEVFYKEDEEDDSHMIDKIINIESNKNKKNNSNGNLTNEQPIHSPPSSNNIQQVNHISPISTEDEKINNINSIERIITKPNIEKKSKKILNEQKEYKYKDIKSENYDSFVDDRFIQECLNEHSINGDLALFKRIYIDDIPKEYYPIRHIKKKLQYWCDGHMNNDDSNGTYIKNTNMKNIEKCYLKINTYDNFTSNMEDFIKNQEHISNLSDSKYKYKFLQKIISTINI